MKCFIVLLIWKIWDDLNSQAMNKVVFSIYMGRRKGDAEGANALSIFGKLHHWSQILGDMKKYCNKCSCFKICCTVNYKPLRQSFICVIPLLESCAWLASLEYIHGDSLSAHGSMKFDINWELQNIQWPTFLWFHWSMWKMLRATLQECTLASSVNFDTSWKNPTK